MQSKLVWRVLGAAALGLALVACTPTEDDTTPDTVTTTAPSPQQMSQQAEPPVHNMEAACLELLLKVADIERISGNTVISGTFSEGAGLGGDHTKACMYALDVTRNLPGATAQDKRIVTITYVADGHDFWRALSKSVSGKDLMDIGDEAFAVKGDDTPFVAVRKGKKVVSVGLSNERGTAATHKLVRRLAEAAAKQL